MMVVISGTKFTHTHIHVLEFSQASTITNNCYRRNPTHTCIHTFSLCIYKWMSIMWDWPSSPSISEVYITQPHIHVSIVDLGPPPSELVLGCITHIHTYRCICVCYICTSYSRGTACIYFLAFQYYYRWYIYRYTGQTLRCSGRIDAWSASTRRHLWTVVSFNIWKL